MNAVPALIVASTVLGFAASIGFVGSKSGLLTCILISSAKAQLAGVTVTAPVPGSVVVSFGVNVALSPAVTFVVLFDSASSSSTVSISVLTSARLKILVDSTSFLTTESVYESSPAPGFDSLW